MNEYFSDLIKNTDKLVLALKALEAGHNFSTIKYKLNKEAGKIADLICEHRTIGRWCYDTLWAERYLKFRGTSVDGQCHILPAFPS